MFVRYGVPSFLFDPKLEKTYYPSDFVQIHTKPVVWYIVVLKVFRYFKTQKPLQKTIYNYSFDFRPNTALSTITPNLDQLAPACVPREAYTAVVEDVLRSLPHYPMAHAVLKHKPNDCPCK